MRRPPRLLLVGPLPPPNGGMANQTRQLRQLLEAEGIEVSVVQTNAPYKPAWVAGLTGIRAVFRLVPYLRQLLTETRNADVVHVMANSGWAWRLFAAPAVTIARWRGTRTVVNYRGGLAAEFLQHSASRVRAKMRGATLVVPSEFLREIFSRHQMNSIVIPNVVDLQLFRPSVSAATTRDPARPHVVIARNLEHIYGIDLGLRALAMLRRQIPGVRASITGTGPEQRALSALVDELGLGEQVTFTGRLEPAAMAELFQSADLVLNPVRADNSPNSVLEALACGVPVVSTNVGGIPFLVEHDRSAVLVEPESAEALASGMARILADPELRQRLIARGLELAQARSWSAAKSLWWQVYGFTAANRDLHQAV